MKPGSACPGPAGPARRVLLLALNVAVAAGGSPFDDAVAASAAISTLSDEIQVTERKIERWQLKRDQAKQLYEEQRVALERQIDVRQRQIGRWEAGEAAHGKAVEQALTRRMCLLIFSGFSEHLDKDQASRKEVTELCLGRNSLALATASSRLRHSALRARLAQTWTGATLRRLGRSLTHISREVNGLVAADRHLERHCMAMGGCMRLRGPALRQTLVKLQVQLEIIEDQFRKDSERWDNELAELSRRAEKLGSEAHSNHQDKQDMKEAAWARVKDAFCPTVNEHYSLDDEKIVELATRSCG